MKNILIYGAGGNCEVFLHDVVNKNFNVLAIIDKNKCGSEFEGITIESPDKIQDYKYDEIYITPRENENIVETLVNIYNVPKNNIKLPEDINNEYIIPKIDDYANVIIASKIDKNSCFAFVFKKLLENTNTAFIRLLDCKNSIHIDKISYKKKLFIFISYSLVNIKSNGFFENLILAYPNSKKFLWLCDPFEDPLYGVPQMVREFDSVENLKKTFDYCYTYHIQDAKKYNFLFYPQFFPNINVNEYADDKRYDVFFIGNVKKRKQLIYEVYDKLISIGLKCQFLLFNVPKEERIDNGIVYTDIYINYSEILKEIAKSKCILEVCNNGDETSFRFAEAVVFNKKLLINDDSVRERMYYNENNMKIYHSADDVKADWFLEETENYNYKGEYDTEYYLKNVLQILL